MELKELFYSIPCEVYIKNEWGTVRNGDLTIIIAKDSFEVSYQEHGGWDGPDYISKLFLYDNLIDALEEMKKYLDEQEKEGKLIRKIYNE